MLPTPTSAAALGQRDTSLVTQRPQPTLGESTPLRQRIRRYRRPASARSIDVACCEEADSRRTPRRPTWLQRLDSTLRSSARKPTPEGRPAPTRLQRLDSTLRSSARKPIRGGRLDVRHGSSAWTRHGEAVRGSRPRRGVPRPDMAPAPGLDTPLRGARKPILEGHPAPTWLQRLDSNQGPGG
jgi:hypothetical protein